MNILKRTQQIIRAIKEKKWTLDNEICASNESSPECLKFYKDYFELSKLECKYGGFCYDIPRFTNTYFFLSNVKNEYVVKEEVEKCYDELIAFLEELDLNDRETAKVLKDVLIQQYHSMAVSLSEKVDIQKYYSQRKEKINSNIEKAIELDKKFSFLTKNDYKNIYTMYKRFKDSEKENRFFNLYNSSNKEEEPIVIYPGKS